MVMLQRQIPIKIFFCLAALVVVTIFFGMRSGTACAQLTCTVSTSCAGGTVILKLSSTTNAHAEIFTQNNYSQLVCCSGVTGLGTSCSGNYGTLVKLSSTSNAHLEHGTGTNYSNSICLSAPGAVTVAYRDSNCTGYDTTVLSISSTTNAHAGTSTAHTRRVCASVAAAAPQSLSFILSDNTIGFGTLSPVAARYATGDTNGTTTEIEAHTLAANTNASAGYNITVRGGTLASSGRTIDAIGATNSGSSPGSEQFGLRITASGGVGTVEAPYAASGFAYAADATNSSTIALAATGDSATTTYSIRYVANVGQLSETGSYSTTLTYIIVANF